MLSGHRTKCFFAGVDDLTTTRYLTSLLGSEYVTRTVHLQRRAPACSAAAAAGRRSVSRAEQRVDFAPANTVRQMNPGEAVLLHGTLPPIHLEAVRWWAQKDLAALVPLDDDGNPAPPADLPTCPLGPDAPAAENPARRRSHPRLHPRRAAQHRQEEVERATHPRRPRPRPAR